MVCNRNRYRNFEQYKEAKLHLTSHKTVLELKRGVSWRRESIHEEGFRIAPVELVLCRSIQLALWHYQVVFYRGQGRRVHFSPLSAR